MLTLLRYAPAFVAMALAFAMIRRDRGGFEHLFQFGLGSAACAAILGSGAIFQAIFGEVLLPSNQPGLVYSVELNTFAYLLSAAKTIVLEGFRSGPVLALLILRTPCGSTARRAMITATAVLIAFDVIDAATSYGLTYRFYVLRTPQSLYNLNVFNTLMLGQLGNTLRFSILCDVLGGWLAGLLCAWILREMSILITAPNVLRGIIAAFIAIAVYVPAAGALITLFYIIFVHPRDQHVVFAIHRQHGMHVQIGDATGIMPQIWGLPQQDLGISGALQLVLATPTPSQTTVDIWGVRNCESPEKSADAPEDGGTSGPLQVSMADKAVTIFGGTERAELVLGDQSSTQKALLSFPSGTRVSIGPTQDGARQTVGFSGKVQFEVWMSPADKFVVSGFDYGNGTLELAATSKTHNSVYQIDKATTDTCERVPLRAGSVPPQAGKLESVGLVVGAPDARPNLPLLIDAQNISIEVPNGVGFLDKSLPYARTFTSYIEVSVDDGAITVGTEKYTLAPDYTVIMAGQNIAVAREGELIVATGDVPYVTLNGISLTKAAFWYLPPELQVAIFTAFAGGLVWLIRRTWPWLRTKLFY